MGKSGIAVGFPVFHAPFSFWTAALPALAAESVDVLTFFRHRENHSTEYRNFLALSNEELEELNLRQWLRGTVPSRGLQPGPLEHFLGRASRINRHCGYQFVRCSLGDRMS
jgi:hypothetical protein